MAGPNQHVIKRGDRWLVQGTGEARASSHHETVRAAIEAARQVARRTGGQIVIHPPGTDVESATGPTRSHVREVKPA